MGGILIAALRTKHDRLVAKLRDVSRADPLTGLLDERGLDEAFVSELERARRSNSRFGVLVATVDGLDELREADRGPALVAAGDVIEAAKREIDSGARMATSSSYSRHAPTSAAPTVSRSGSAQGPGTCRVIPAE